MPPMVTLDVPWALPKPLPKTAIGTPRLLGPPVVGPLSISANRIVGGAGATARWLKGAPRADLRARGVPRVSNACLVLSAVRGSFKIKAAIFRTAA